MDHRTSLVIQWLRLHLPMQGHRFNLWSRKIPHGTGQISPPQLQLCLHLQSLQSRAQGPPLLSPCATTIEALVP